MRSSVCIDITERPAEMLHKSLCNRCVIIERYHLIKNGSIAGLPDVCAGSGNEPKGIVAESRTDVGVALLGKRLVLVICTSVLKLG